MSFLVNNTTALVLLRSLLIAFFACITFLMPLSDVGAQEGIIDAEDVYGIGREGEFGGTGIAVGDDALDAFGGSGPDVEAARREAAGDDADGVTGRGSNPSEPDLSRERIEQRLADASWGKWIYSILVGIGGIFTYIGGNALNLAVTYLVIGFGDLATQNIGVLIDEAWTIIRDLFNILFIFGLIYIGFKTILNAGDSSTKRMLVSLIAAALLINFSLFISKTIVDFSNVAAYQVVQLMTTGGTGTADPDFTIEFVDVMKLDTFLDSNITNMLVDTENPNDANIRVVVFGFLFMIFAIVAGVVFLAGAILLVARFIALVIFMIFSPVMFLGMIFPAFSQYQKMWWTKFLSNAFVAPAYLFMVYLSLRVLQFIVVGAGSFSSEFASPGTLQVFLWFILAIGFLIASLMVARHMSAAGAETSIKFANSARRGIQGFAGRNTVGRLADWRGRRYQQWQSENGFFARTARTLGADQSIQKFLDRGAEAKFGSSQSRADIKKYGREREKDLDRTARIANLRKALQSGDETKIKTALAQATPAQISEMAKEHGSKSGLAGDRRLLEQAVPFMNEAQYKSFKDSDDVRDSDRESIEEARIKSRKINQIIEGGGSADDIAREAGTLGASTVKELLQNEAGRNILLNPNVAPNLSSSATKAIFENEGSDPQFVSAFRNKRKAGITANLNVDPATPENIKEATSDQLRSLGSDVFANEDYFMYLQDSQLKEIEKMVGDGVLSQNEFNELKAKRKEAINNVSDIATAQKIIASRKGAVEIAKLPETFLESDTFIDALDEEKKLNFGTLNKIAQESNANKKEIGRKVRIKITDPSSNSYDSDLASYNPAIDPEPDSPWIKWFKSDNGLEF